MLKLLYQIPSKKVLPDRGFTMIEVLIGIVIISTFILVSMQAIALNTFFKVKAEREAQANFWIQQDLENVRAEAANLGKGSITNTAPCQATTYNNGYAKELQDELTKSSTTTNSNIVIAEEKNFVNSEIKQPGKDEKFYKLVRTYLPDNSSPNVLKINYQVGKSDDWVDGQNAFKSDSHSPIAKLYAEVIPNVAFDCTKK